MTGSRERHSRRREVGHGRDDRRRGRRHDDSDRSLEREKRQRRRREYDRREAPRSRRRSRSRSRSKERRRSKRSSSPKRERETSRDKRQKQEEPLGMKKMDFSADITPEDVQLMQQMGIPFGFETTKGKRVESDDTNTGAIRTKTLRQARQYMNRKVRLWKRRREWEWRCREALIDRCRLRGRDKKSSETDVRQGVAVRVLSLRMELALLATCGVGVRDEPQLDSRRKRDLEALRNGAFGSVLSDERFAQCVDPAVSLERRRSAVGAAVTEAVNRGDREACESLLCFGAAALLQFVQQNVTGPNPLQTAEKANVEDAAVRKSLEVDGEDFFPMTSSPELLLLSRSVLVEPLSLHQSTAAAPQTQTVQIGDVAVELAEDVTPLDYLKARVPSWLWWAARAVTTHQKFLKHLSASLRKECAAVMSLLDQEILHKRTWLVAHRAQLCLEMAQWELLYRQIQAAEHRVHRAEDLLNVKIGLSGAMGTRTVHQIDAKAQLVAHVHRTGEAAAEDVESCGVSGSEMWGVTGHEDDILMRPKLSKEEEVPQISCLEQCLAFAVADLVELGTAKDGLQSWETEPFTQLIQSQKQSAFALQVKAALCRVLHEKDRGRTRERSLLMLEKLLEHISGGDAARRTAFVFCLRVPTLLQCRKQLAEHYVSFGIISSALEIYEQLKMWDELVVCYRLLEKKAMADAIVTEQLGATPNSPSLLCTLGDLRSDRQLYQRAWEVSGQTYPRAQRSLASYALAKKDFTAAVEAYELALKLNSLHPDAWFSLGYCYLKLDNDTQALKAFTWCAQLEAENGEAWNNLAALWMRQKKPDRALWALKEAVKYKHSSWETWENYAKASQDCGEHGLALHGMQKVLELTDGQRLQAELLSGITTSILSLALSQPSTLLTRLESFLRHASQTTGWKAQFWLSLARVQRRTEQPDMAKECLTKCFRHLQGSTWKSDAAHFALMVEAASQLVDLLQDRDRPSLSLQLRGILKQAVDVYPDTPELETLHALQNRLTG